ncbi:MAG: leucine-rich repeat domain-containing protein [Verrucomicrobiota bacterium]|nr:leucine-rich repeat domain-containing protein [Verrucomicrobiota bacterium]
MTSWASIPPHHLKTFSFSTTSYAYDPIARQSIDVLIKIFDYLSAKDQALAGRVSRSWNLIAHRDTKTDIQLAKEIRKFPGSPFALEPIDKNGFQVRGQKVIQWSKKGLESLSEEQVDSLRDVEELDLSDNQLKVLPFSLSQLPHLRALVLDGNPLERIPICLYLCRRLEYLSIEETRIPLSEITRFLFSLAGQNRSFQISIEEYEEKETLLLEFIQKGTSMELVYDENNDVLVLQKKPPLISTPRVGTKRAWIESQLPVITQEEDEEPLTLDSWEEGGLVTESMETHDDPAPSE